MKLNLKHSFDAAHRLEFHEGLCRNLHGHRWEVEVEIEALPSDKWIIDFGEIKKIINELDHSTMLKICPENQILIDALLIINKDKLYLFDSSPTAENITFYLEKKIRQKINNLNIHPYQLKVKVWESPNASIEI